MMFVVTYQIMEFIATLAKKGMRHVNNIKYYPITVIVVAYLPNEQSIVMDILKYYRQIILDYSEHAECNLILAYNTPSELAVEEELADFASENDWFIPLKVPNSKSKAENINHALEQTYIHDVVGIYDTDHHPRANSLERASYWIGDRDYDYIQGRNIIRNANNSMLEMLVRFDFDMMYALFHEARYSLQKIALFGGSNGYWKREVIRELRFRSKALTEDIDCSVRGIIGGYRGYFDKYLVSSEEAPPSFRALYKQRRRWSQGWSEVSLWHTFASLRTPHLNIWQKVNMFCLFVVRELFVYFQVLGMPIFIMETIKAQAPVLDYFSFAVTIYSLFYYPILVTALYFSVERGEWHNNWTNVIGAMFINMFVKSIWDPILALQGHFRNFVGMNKWVITPRAGAENLPPIIFVDNDNDNDDE